LETRLLFRAGARWGLGGAQHPHWKFPAPVLRWVHSTPTQHPQWTMTMITQFRGTKNVIILYKSCMIAILQQCGCVGVETPTTWRLLNLLTSDIVASYWVLTTDGPWHINVCVNVTHENCSITARFWFTSFWPCFYRATRMRSADYDVARCLSVRLYVCLPVRHSPILYRNI